MIPEVGGNMAVIRDSQESLNENAETGSFLHNEHLVPMKASHKTKSFVSSLLNFCYNVFAGMGIMVSLLLILYLFFPGVLLNYTMSKEDFYNHLMGSEIVNSDPALREVAVNQTYDCGTKDSECRMLKLKDFVYNDIKYIPTPQLFSPQEILKTKAGDCKNKAVLYCSLLRNLGVSCDLITNSCHSANWAMVGRDKYFVDATNNVVTTNETLFMKKMNEVCR
jgi:hypothetical protein